MAGFLEERPMGSFVLTAQDLLGQLMGHFVQENLPDGSPGVVQNEFAAQGDLPPVS
jgi:hypothetical protein